MRGQAQRQSEGTRVRMRGQIGGHRGRMSVTHSATPGTSGLNNHDTSTHQASKVDAEQKYAGMCHTNGHAFENALLQRHLDHKQH